jgi:hypothetical protein
MARSVMVMWRSTIGGHVWRVANLAQVFRPKEAACQNPAPATNRTLAFWTLSSTQMA